MSNNIIDKTAIQSVTEQFSSYGEYVGLSRHIPYVFDGLKPSYRRLIQSAFETCKDKFEKVSKLTGYCMGNYHPHGDASLTPVVGVLVNAGIFEGQGNFGFSGILDSYGMAAPRYVESRMSPNWVKLLSPLIPYVPKFRNELGSLEYEYLPVPIPLGLTFGYLGIAIGTGCRIPEFTPSSILDAYLNDNPRLLKNASGLEIINPESLDRLWTEGRGHIKYKINTYMEEGWKSVAEGRVGCVKPNFEKLMSWKDSARITIIDESTDIPKIVVHKLPRVQWPSNEEIYEELVKAVSGSESYYIRAVYNGSVRDLGIKDWIDITYKNYMKLLEKYRVDNIEKLKFNILIYKNFRKVADFMIKEENKNVSYEAIAEKFSLPIEVVNNISGKTLHQLRTYNPENKIEDAEKQIKEFENLDKEKFVKTTIDTMEVITN